MYLIMYKKVILIIENMMYFIYLGIVSDMIGFVSKE